LNSLSLNDCASADSLIFSIHLRVFYLSVVLKGIKQGSETSKKQPRSLFSNTLQKKYVISEPIFDWLRERLFVIRLVPTVKELVPELIEAKRTDGRSEIYLRDLRNMLAIFSRDFGDRPIAGVTVDGAGHSPLWALPASQNLLRRRLARALKMTTAHRGSSQPSSLLENGALRRNLTPECKYKITITGNYLASCGQ
jgi:hypothetical protein